MKCKVCDWDYPSHLLSPLVSNRGSEMMCGICALAVSNEIHGVNRDKFQGAGAEFMRQSAIVFRMHNPGKGPKTNASKS